MTAGPEDLDDLMTALDAARILGLSSDMVRLLAREGCDEVIDPREEVVPLLNLRLRRRPASQAAAAAIRHPESDPGEAT